MTLMPKACAFRGCKRGVKAKGLCPSHYAQQRRGYDLHPIGKRPPRKPCTFPRCGKPRVAWGLCHGHHAQQKNGKELTRLRVRLTQPDICTFPDCGKEAQAKSLCNGHYLQQLRGAELKTLRKLTPRVGKTCAYDGCEDGVVRLGWCNGHYNQHDRDPDNMHPIGERSPKWLAAEAAKRTVRKIDDHGYAKIYRPEYPVARTNGSYWVLEHRFKMSELLGRPLEKHENVHHRNGVRDDNRTHGRLRADPKTGRLYSGNLELWSSSQPKGQRVGDKVKWAREIIELYGDLFPTA